MKHFRFSLQQVLDLKAHQKQEVAIDLAALEHDRENLEKRLDRLASEWAAEKKALNSQVSELKLAEYRMRVQYLEYLDATIQKERKALLALAGKIAEKRQKLLRCAQEERALSLLRGRHATAYEKAVRAGERRKVDELNIQRTLHQLLDSGFHKKYVM